MRRRYHDLATLPLVRPANVLRGTVLVTVPHMDDEILGCGGALAGLPDKRRVHLLYATSGRGSENLAMPGIRVSTAIDMGAIRKQESLAALACLGIPPEQAHFLDIPDYQVRAYASRVRAEFTRLLEAVKPDWVLTPFRYDRHRDHVALSRIVRARLAELRPAPGLLEYFVYYRWRLLRAGDVRCYCRPEYLVGVDTAPQRALKRQALAAFTSQTTMYFPWQTRPVLSAELLDEVAQGPEWFLRAAPAAPDRTLFTLPPAGLRMCHTVEPWLKRRKDQTLFLIDTVKRRRKTRAVDPRRGKC